ncbi:hypothetical protein NPIL_494741 [Nephila pilipes]|uniref:Uncharacterized protein n=1 Tax=Nephila pilipes TaxID=299642 RepID=A0A8X6T7B4_NEPPI|nr:hypothetical protein NPIL_494741 [Nephila pilipes]
MDLSVQNNAAKNDQVSCAEDEERWICTSSSMHQKDSHALKGKVEGIHSGVHGPPVHDPNTFTEFPTVLTPLLLPRSSVTWAVPLSPYLYGTVELGP